MPALATASDAKTREATHDFATEVLGALRRVHRTFIGLVRHDYMQHWLRPWEDPNYSEAPDQRLAWYDARWQIPDGGWKALHPHCPRCQTSVVVFGRQTAVLTKDAWASFERALETGAYRAKPYRRLLANAFAQFSRRELRAAIVEGVAAWEMVLATLVPARLAEQRVVFDEAKWRALLDKTGLRAGTDLAFALLPELGGAHAVHVVRAVELRNNVIHQGATGLDATEIDRCLWALRAVIANCEGGGPF